MEDDQKDMQQKWLKVNNLIFFENGRKPQFFENGRQPSTKTMKIKSTLNERRPYRKSIATKNNQK